MPGNRSRSAFAKSQVTDYVYKTSKAVRILGDEVNKPLAVLIVVIMSASAAAQTVVTYPASQSPHDTRFDDLKEILHMALQKTEHDYGPFVLRESEAWMNEARYLFELRTGRMLDVVWSSTSEQRESDLLPIRIPLRKGILGYRISLIHKDNQAKIDAVRTLDDLSRLTLVQGIGWGDVDIYRANGIQVYATGYESLFMLVNANRADLFPRGIGEVYDEYEARKSAQPNMVVEENLVIYYPWPYYFFTNRKNTALAERIETGLRRMIADGEMDEIFWRYNGDDIRRANLAKRRVIEIENHLLPAATPIDDASLWFNPFE